MSAFSKMQRASLRVAYDRFCQAWRNERRYQEHLLATGQELEEGHAKLGRKPTFAMWMAAVEQRQVQAALAEKGIDPKRVVVKDTEWEN